MTKYAEVKADYTDDQNITMIDGWKTGDDNEEGRSIAAVCRDTGKVIFFDNGERFNKQVRGIIVEVLQDLERSGEVDGRRGYLKANIEMYKQK